MTVDQINRNAYNFVEKLRILKRVPKKTKDTGSIAEAPSFDLSQYEVNETPSFERKREHNNKNSHIVLKLNKTIYGFDKETYPDFFSFVDEILTLKEIEIAVTDKFIEEKTLIWIVDVFQNKKSSVDLISFLKDKIEESTEDRVYYFPILNFHINKEFRIGDILITFLTKQFFDELWDKYRFKEHYSIENFDNILRKYQGQVFASVRVKAEHAQGKLIAFESCSLAIDILKMYTPTVIFPNRRCLFDLEERINVNHKSDSLSYIFDRPQELKITTSVKADPLFINDEVLEYFRINRIEVFSTFLRKYDKRNELQRLLIQAIKLYSIAISTGDLHFRTAQLVTISESLLLEDDLKYKLEKNCKQRFVAILFPTESKESYDFFNKLTQLYQVRHKIMHKAIKLKIDLDYLSEFQTSIIDLLQMLIKISYKIETKEEMIKEIEKKTKGIA